MTGLGGWSLEGMGKLVLFYTVKKQRPGSVWQTSPLGTGPPRDTDHRPLQLKGPLRMAGPVLQAKLWGLPLTSWVTLAKERVVLVLPSETGMAVPFSP